MKEVTGYGPNIGCWKPTWVKTTSMHWCRLSESAVGRRVSLQSGVVVEVGEHGRLETELIEQGVTWSIVGHWSPNCMRRATCGVDSSGRLVRHIEM